MTTIQEIRDALKAYDGPLHGTPSFGGFEQFTKAKASLLANAPDYIRTLLAEVDRLIESKDFHRDLGITLLDAKYLDPSCHQGCKSLVWQGKLTKAEQERDALRAEVEQLKSRIEPFRIHSGKHALGPMFGTFQPKDTAPNSSGFDPLLNKPGAISL